MTEQNWKEIFYTSRDGLRLHVRYYPSGYPKRRPLLCLPGLTRNSKDFHKVATFLSTNSQFPFDVYSVDYRGRGQSDHDPNWRNYTPFVEARDILDFLTLRQLHKVSIIGTSRGGLIAMLFGALRPTILGGLVLNDIGPEIQRLGLLRIRNYVGRTPVPRDWNEATQIAMEINQRQFPNVSQEEWGEIVRMWYNEVDGNPAPGYDPALSYGLSMIDLSDTLPSMWPQFESLRRCPVMVIKGENSDILSVETVDRMAELHENLVIKTVAGQGHAPLLTDQETLNEIELFLTRSLPGRDRLHIASDAA